MKVCEIFASVQGESSFAGLPCVFIRLSGCNLRCLYCDTKYAYRDGIEMTQEEIVNEVCGYGIGLVEITGGEPLLQEEVKALMRKLLDMGYTALLETNGTIDITGIDGRVAVIMDVKTPGSGFPDCVRKENFAALKMNDELKFVLSGREDYEWAVNFICRHGLAGKCAIMFSPVFGKLAPGDLACWIIDDRLNVRLNIQLHKYIYGPDARGV